MRFSKIWWDSWWQLKKLCELPRCLFKGYWGVIFLCRVFLVSSIFFSKCLYFSYYMAGYLLDRPRTSFPFKKHESEHTDLLVPWHVCFVLFSTRITRIVVRFPHWKALAWHLFSQCTDEGMTVWVPAGPRACRRGVLLTRGVQRAQFGKPRTVLPASGTVIPSHLLLLPIISTSTASVQKNADYTKEAWKRGVDE